MCSLKTRIVHGEGQGNGWVSEKIILDLPAVSKHQANPVGMTCTTTIVRTFTSTLRTCQKEARIYKRPTYEFDQVVTHFASQTFSEEWISLSSSLLFLTLILKAWFYYYHFDSTERKRASRGPGTWKKYFSKCMQLLRGIQEAYNKVSVQIRIEFRLPLYRSEVYYLSVLQVMKCILFSVCSALNLASASSCLFSKIEKLVNSHLLH